MIHHSVDLPADALKPRELEVLRLMAEGLTNQEIADQLYIAVSTVRWYNRQIYSKFGVHNRTLVVAQARELGLLDTAPAQPASGTAVTNSVVRKMLGRKPPLVGREREIARIRNLISSTRLLTLTGPGGTGKTRLALEAAVQMEDYYTDGVGYVGLAAISEPQLVPNTIAQVLNVAEVANEPTIETLIRHLEGKHILLLLDNFEHVIEALPVLTDLLTGAPQLKIIVTSREVLHLYGEQEYPVPPLAVPANPDVLTHEQLHEFESVRLFVQHTRTHQPNFYLTEENSRIVGHLCKRLDGLPLAIELAAAQMRLLTPEIILSRLEGGLNVLGQGPRDAPAHQRTLRATIDWSYNLLSDEEKKLFARLSVFQGGWSLEALEVICADDLGLDVFDGLTSLVNKSLVVQSIGSDGEPRFSMLETLQEYALEQLEAEDTDALYDRYAAWYLELAETGNQGLLGTDSQRWFERLQREADNFRAALSWYRRKPDGNKGMQLSGALMNYWHTGGHCREARAWLTEMLALADDTPTRERARALNGAGVMAWRQGDYDEVVRFCGEALAISQQLGDAEDSALALHYLAHSAQEQANFPRAIEMLTESQRLYTASHSIWGQAKTLNCLGDLYRQLGEYGDAEILLRESLALHGQQHNQRGVMIALSNLGHVLYRQGKIDEAVSCFRESLEIAEKFDSEPCMLLVVAGLAGVAVVCNKFEHAAQLLAAVEALLPMVGVILEPSDRDDFDDNLAETRGHLADEAFAQAWSAGQSMTLRESIVAATNAWEKPSA